MKIKDVKVIVTCPGRNYVLVKIYTDTPGLYGVGDATLNGRELSVASTLEQHLAPLLLGKDPDRIEDLWQMIFRGTYWRGGPVLQTALAGIDTALWDIKGKRAGLPVYSLLGGKTRDGVLAYSHAGGRDPIETEDRVRERMSQGYKVVRAQVGIPGTPNTYGVGGAKEAASATWRSSSTPAQTDPDKAEEALEPGVWGDGNAMPEVEVWETNPYVSTVPKLFSHLREALGFEVELIHDVHERLTPIQAAQLAKDLEPYKLFFLEDPLRPEHKESFRLIRHHSTTPIAMGELFHTKWDALPLISEQLIDFIRCDIGHLGGLTEARKVATLAEFYQVKTAWHGPGDIAPPTHAVNVHLDFAIPNFGVQESVEFPDIVHEVLPGCPTYENGYLHVTDAPGLGTDLNEEAAKKYPYQRAYLPMMRRADGSVHDW